tara:strand:+ start:1357 stop:2118 length:762 start_codon:yes stop_codon:yes gene_type:complete
MIPKTIHLSWVNKDILFTSHNPLAVNGIQNMKNINPEYTIVVSDDQDVDNYIQSYISEDDWLLLRDRHIVEKIDLWRLLKIYNEGGIYCDVDRLCNIPFDDFITEDDICILPTHYQIDFSQDIMISASGQDIHKLAIDLNLSRRQEGCVDVLTLGPVTYFHAITYHIFGKQLSRFLDPMVWQLLIKTVNLREGYITYEERPVENLREHSTIIYQYDNKYKEGNGLSKDDFYKESKIDHWTKGDNVFGKKLFGN